MKKRDNIIILLFCSMSLHTEVSMAHSRLDSLLLELDETIRKEHIYTELKKSRLENIKLQLTDPFPTEEKRYEIYRSLATGYESFICDSTLKYDNKSLELAETINNESWILDSKIHLSETLAQASLFSDAMTLLENASRENMSSEQLIAYYKAHISTYTFQTEFYANTYAKRDLYIDSLLRVITPEHAFEYVSFKGLLLIGWGELDKAEEILLNYLPNISPADRDYAIYTARLAHLYARKGDIEKQKEYLALSAICDIKGAVKENLSLSLLATLLFNEGDIHKANFYIKKSMEDANFYNGKLRSLQILKVLPMIDKVYQSERTALQHKLTFLLSIVSVLSIVLLISIGFIIRQIKKMAQVQKEIIYKNENLNELNERLKLANEHQARNNINLMEANHIKERFIHNFLDLCTQYITKLNSFKLTVKRKIMAGQTTDILRLTASDNEHELKELYRNFDKAFLQIYPNFVSEINKLLRDETQYPANESLHLNQELRIFALIRLGITDTNKIATFLHYSLRTVYNYRSKVRTKALNPEEDFEEKIKQIGIMNIS